MTQPVEVGSRQWEALVSRARASDTVSAWEVGDAALEAVPIGNDEVARRLHQFAEETEISFPKLQRYRDTSRAWPLAKRLDDCSHRTHLILATLPDRFRVIYPGMKVADAEDIMAQRKRVSSDPAHTTLLSILASITETRHRLRIAFRDTMNFGPSDSDKEHILGGLAELETEAEQFRKFLTGMGLDEAIAEILEGTR